MSAADIKVRTNYWFSQWMLDRVAVAADAQGITRIAFIRRAIAVALTPRRVPAPPVETPAPVTRTDDIQAIQDCVGKYETLLHKLNTRYGITETLSVDGCEHGRVPASSCTEDDCSDAALHTLWNEVME